MSATLSERAAAARSMSSSMIDGEGLPDLALVGHDAVIGVQRQPGDEDAVAHRARLDGRGDAQRLHGFGDVVHAHDRRAVLHRREMAGDRAAEPLVGRRRRHRIDEALARGADQKRQAEALEFGKPRDAGDALLRRLAEADAGIEHDASRGRCRRAAAIVERALEEGMHVGDDVDARGRRSRGYA